MFDFIQKLADVLSGPAYDSESRALLYAKEKREDLLQAECLRIVQSESLSKLSRMEYPLHKDEVLTWNDSLRLRGYFDSKSAS